MLKHSANKSDINKSQVKAFCINHNRPKQKHRKNNRSGLAVIFLDI